MKLVIAGDLLDWPLTRILEHDEVAKQVKEASSFEHSTRQDFKHVGSARRDFRAVDRPPLMEPLRGRCETPKPGVNAIRNDHQLVEGEEVRQLSLIGLELVEGRPDGDILLARIFQFEGCDGKAVNEEDDVETPMARLVGAYESELVDRQPVVAVRLVEINQPHGPPSDLPVLTNLDRHAVDEMAVEAPVVEQGRGGVRAAKDADSLVDGGRAQGRIDPLQCRPKTPDQKNLAEVGTLGRLGIWRDLTALHGVITQVAQPRQEGFLEDCFPTQVVHGGEAYGRFSWPPPPLLGPL